MKALSNSEVLGFFDITNENHPIVIAEGNTIRIDNDSFKIDVQVEQENNQGISLRNLSQNTSFF